MLADFYRRTIRPLFDPGPTTDAHLAVVGVGGAGGNAVNNMVEQGIAGVDFIAVNTDSQDLANNRADRCLLVGETETGKLGAGARPEIGAAAVDESRGAVERAIRPYDMLFITAGMGGGTGTGGAPVVASIAQELGILTVGIVTRPFECEGPRRVEAADRGIQELRAHADTLLVVPNERLLDMAGQHTSLVKAFEMADEVLYDATRGISDLITYEGLVNLDFADVETTMKDGGVALLGMSTEFDLRQRSVSSPRARPVGDGAPARTGDPGAASGASRTEEAAMEAVSSPLFGTQSIRGADRVLVNVTGGPSLGIRDATSALERIQAEAGDGCNVIFGAVVDEAMKGKFQVTVVATGLNDPAEATTSDDAPSHVVPSTGPAAEGGLGREA